MEGIILLKLWTSRTVKTRSGSLLNTHLSEKLAELDVALAQLALLVRSLVLSQLQLYFANSIMLRGTGESGSSATLPSSQLSFSKLTHEHKEDGNVREKLDSVWATPEMGTYYKERYVVKRVPTLLISVWTTYLVAGWYRPIGNFNIWAKPPAPFPSLH